MLYKTKVYILAGILFVAGLGLSLGAIVVAPLIIPGTILITVSTTMVQSVYSENPKESPEIEVIQFELPSELAKQDHPVNLFFIYKNDSKITEVHTSSLGDKNSLKFHP